MAAFSGITRKLEEKLNENNLVTHLLADLETRSGVKRLYLATGFLAFSALYLVFGYGPGLICNLISFLYPAYLSMQALESANNEDNTKWLTYWVVFAVFSIAEFFVDIIFYWVPFYWLYKCVFLIYCYCPYTNGAQVMYNRIARPIFLKNRDIVEKALDEAKDKLSEGVANIAADALKKD